MVTPSFMNSGSPTPVWHLLHAAGTTPSASNAGKLPLNREMPVIDARAFARSMGCVSAWFKSAMES